MKMLSKIALIVLVAIMSARAQESPIGPLYRSILAQPEGGDIPTFEELNKTVNETTVRALSVAEVKALLPLAKQCIQSTQPKIREAGMGLFLSVALRYDSAGLLEPYIDDLGKLLDGSEDYASLRHLDLTVLGLMQPKLPPKAIALLDAHLEDKGNSAQETLTIAASLIKAAPTDASTLHKILMVVSNRADPGLTNSVIRQLGLSKSRLPEAMDFISANLNKEDPGLRASAVDAVSRLDKDKRALFSSQLVRISSDARESQHVRTQATQALEP